MKKALFLIECSAPHWIEVAKALGHAQAEVVYWTGWNKIASAVHHSFPTCVFHDTLDAKRALNPVGGDSVAGPFDDACEFVWRNEAQVVYDMLNRFDYSRDLTFVERSTLFYRYLVYWREMIKRYSPHIVVFSAPPHVAYDYVLLGLCRSLNITTLMFEEIPIAPPNSLSMNDYRLGLGDLKLKAVDETDEGIQVCRELLARLRGNYGSGAPSRELAARADMKALFAEGRQGLAARVEIVTNLDKAHGGKYQLNEKIVNVSSLYKEKGKSLRASFAGDYANSRFMAQMVEDRFVTEELHACYHAYAVDVAHLDGTKFVYFPLAGQPERTSNPQADIYTNQILVANLVAHGVPPDWKVVVKEHPNQFHPNFAVNMCRSTEYYSALLNLPRVVCVPSLSDSFDLIDRAQLIATTGGTAGMEAVARGKPVLLFGDAWYRNCPGIYRVRSLSDVCEFLEDFQNGSITICPDDFAATCNL